MPRAWPAADQQELRRALRGRTRRPPGAPWPVSSPYGARVDPLGRGLRFHHGIDVPWPLLHPVWAILPGTVDRIDVEDVGERGRSHGNAVRIASAGGWSVSYLHLAAPLVAVGQPVRRGQLVGLSGASGRVTGPHLHLGVFWRGRSLDPAILFAPGSLH